MPDISNVSPQEFRDFNDNSSVALNREEIKIAEVRNLNIPVDGGNIKARLYSNNETEALVIYFHGGGFVFGNIDTHDPVCRFLARESGCKVLSVDYRLAPEYRFPTAVNDAYGAYFWALENSNQLGISKERICIAGDSAGSNLCAVLSVKARDNGVRVPRMQLLFYPVVAADTASKSQREFSDGYFLTGAMSAWFMKQYMNSPVDLISPDFAVLNAGNLSGLPETIIFTAEYDPLRDQGETFLSKLRSSGTQATGIRALGMIHGFVSFFGISRSARNYLLMASGLVGEILSDGQD